MLQDLDRTLEKLLYERGRINKGDVDIAFDTPTSEWSTRLSRPTINLWSYDLRENVRLRSMEMYRQVTQNIVNQQVAPRRIDTSYLVTAWARKVEDEKQLLWRALAALMQVPILDPSACEGTLKNQPVDIPLIIANMSEHPVNLTDLWSVLGNQMKLGFTFVTTLSLDIELVLSAPQVFDRDFGFAQMDQYNPQTTVASDDPIKIDKEGRRNR
jgi:hypothetical protein